MDNKNAAAPALGEFSLTINNGRKYYLRFERLEDLKAAISEHLTPSEIKSGVLDKLTNFNPSRIKNGMVENKWRGFSVCAYVLD